MVEKFEPSGEADVAMYNAALRYISLFLSPSLSLSLYLCVCVCVSRALLLFLSRISFLTFLCLFVFVSACVGKADISSAERWLERMLQRGVKPDAGTFNLMINTEMAAAVDRTLKKLGYCCVVVVCLFCVCLFVFDCCI